ncbi:Hypothetical Protein FCC1311_108812 [Hondaea fermentalgiana]|uniref:Uncharacterized protein n=1 Tax=Hondaea fermentalgiana TaxID=2315210 RepID=A0A2R5GWF1_9STRA|nr:Hypothetical Protein FCC1311_108812 [Hondaea fermentalgiana]|eukprot:GBG34659.1 Hypothetical Protein FCC1311_108812 [Hondaea fermentalgiana]
MVDWDVKSASLVAVAAVLVFAASSRAQTSYGQCGSGNDTVILKASYTPEQVGSDAINLECASLSWSLEGCCGNRLGDSEDDICRSIETASAFCDSASVPFGVTCDNFKPNETMSVTFQVTMTYPDEDETCCQLCKCYGDPLCESFNGTRDQMIECDARDFDSCKLKKDICDDQYDHAGNECIWLKNNRDFSWWNSNLEDGSPCQADYSVSGQLELVMLDVDDFKLVTLIGERGVQTDVHISIPDYDGAFELNSDDCFDFDPRDVGEDGAADAWGLAVDASGLPSAWKVEAYGDVEIRWHIWQPSLGIAATVVCTKAIGASRTRLDIRNVMDTQGRTVGEGFCFSGLIDTEKQNGTNLNNAEGHYKCLELELPDVVTTCKWLTDDTCYARTLSGWQEYWCQNAELEFTKASLSGGSYSDMVATCLTDITSGTDKEQAETWATYACEMNSYLPYGTMTQTSYVTECLKLLEENGWYPWDKVYTGLIQHEWTVNETCKSTLEDFTDIPDDTMCATGVMVEVEVDGTWIPKLYFPVESPPCTDSILEAPGDQYPEFFMYPVRMRQCGLSAECLADSVKPECKPLPTVDVEVAFNTDVCVSTEGGDCTACNLAVETAPEVCTTGANEAFDLGFCEECCNSNNFLLGEEGQSCRELTLPSAFCDASDESQAAYCSKLQKKSGKGVLTLNFTSYTTDMECCATCAIWGDPYGEAFDGSREKLIVCDSRIEGSCFPDKDRCVNSGLTDHGGNDCVWNETVWELIDGHGGNIGAYGSPCTADFAKSGESEVVMYETANPYRLSFYMGERAILDKMLLTTPQGSYTLDAQDCFADDPASAWVTESGVIAATALELTYTGEGMDGYGKDERVWAVMEADLGIFFRMTCVRSRAATTGYIGGYRLNVEHLIDTELSRRESSSSSGYCVSGNMSAYGGSYTANPDAETCEDASVEGAHEACKAFWAGSCTPAQIDLGIKSWCETANTQLSVNSCVNKITNKRSAVTANNWAKAVCNALLPFKMPSDTDKDFVRECMDLGKTEGYYAIVENWGSAGDRASVQSVCVSSVTKYKTRDETDACISGISVQYEDENEEGVWTELFFIPSNKMPCDGLLDIPAWKAKYWPLFSRPVRFEQCDVLNESGACPAHENVEATCMSNSGFTLSMQYTHGVIGCTDDAR